MSERMRAFRTILGSQTTDKSVHAQALLEALHAADSEEERAEMLAVALQERDSVQKCPKSLANKGIADDRWDQLIKTHGDMVLGYLKLAFFKSPAARNFAKEILRLIGFFEGQDEKTFVLAAALYSPYVPFHELPGTPVHMTNDEFQHKIESDKRRTELIQYICRLPFEYTEQASLILQVIDDTGDKDLRVALMAVALSLSNRRAVETALGKLGD